VFTAAPVSPSTGTLVINSSTGEVDIAASDPGNYLVTYTVGGVAESDPFQVVAMQTTGFSYSASSFEDNGIATPTITGSAGGTFTAPEGISINSSTGVIDLAASTVGGPYTITYSNNGICAGTPSTFDVTITATVRIIANNFAMEFNGTDNYVSIYNGTAGGGPSSLNFTSTDSFSISCWIKMVGTSGQENIISFRGTPLIWLYRSGTSIGFRIRGNGSSTESVITKTTTNSAWHNIVAIRDYNGGSPQLKLYIDNGAATPVTDSTSGGFDTYDKFSIGNDNHSGGRFWFDGDIDEVAIWNTALSATAVQEIYDATINNPGYSANLFKLANESQSPVFWNRMGD
jgi:hypothetical protein